MVTSVYILEPFYGGSHKQLVDILTATLKASTQEVFDIHLFTLPAKKWHWRARTSALNMAQIVPRQLPECDRRILFCSSVLNLSEFLSLRRDLTQKFNKNICYFHENQLVYPVQNKEGPRTKRGLKPEEKEIRDFQYGYNSILTATVADAVVFNSQFNKTSFLDNINSFFNKQPNCKPDTASIRETIEAKSSILHFPVKAPFIDELDIFEQVDCGERCVHIVWPHRWEHDKNPESFFEVLFRLKETGLRFKLSVLGESFPQVPHIFDEAKVKLSEEIVHFGRIDSKEDYYRVLASADIAVSTANHEFFGVAMVEAALSGCFPLVPNRLSYPEIFPEACIYRTDQQLFKKLRDFSKKPHIPRRIWDKTKIKVKSFESLQSDYVQLFL